MEQFGEIDAMIEALTRGQYKVTEKEIIIRQLMQQMSISRDQATTMFDDNENPNSDEVEQVDDNDNLDDFF